MTYIYCGTPIGEGDKFYFNNVCVKKKASLPDYLIITGLIPMRDSDNFYIQAKYENHMIGTCERLLSNTILHDSNLNPDAEDPDWIFVKKIKEENANA